MNSLKTCLNKALITTVVLSGSLLISALCSAQNPEEDIKSALGETPGFFLRFDAKNSIISNQGIKLWGLNAGLSHDDTFKYGLGIYGLSTPYYRDFYQTGNGPTDTIHASLNLNYFSIFAEYVFYQTEKWEGSLPIQIGIGGAGFSGSLNKHNYVFHKYPIIHYEATLTGHYRFLRYFALGGGIGYRIMLLNHEDLNLQLTNPIYILKFKFFLGDAYKDVKSIFVK